MSLVRHQPGQDPGDRSVYELGFRLTERAFGLTHSYVLARIEPYVRSDGSPSKLFIWNGTCVVCGAPFEVSSGFPASRLVRSCPAHRAWTGGPGDAARAWNRHRGAHLRRLRRKEKRL